MLRPAARGARSRRRASSAPTPSCASCGWSRTPTRSSCSDWPPRRRIGSSSRSPRAAGRADRGRRRARGPRAAPRRGPRAGGVLDRRLRPEQASPHHEASDRVIRAGEPIVLDIGGTLGGYGSDITRTLWVTGGDPAKGPTRRSAASSASLRAAQAEATAASVPASPPSGSTRRPGDHRCRGLRRAVHPSNRPRDRPRGPRGARTSSPATRSRSGPGMAFSVEPGIYFEGRYGARLEDIVVCGADGPIVLNRAPRDLLRRRRGLSPTRYHRRTDAPSRARPAHRVRTYAKNLPPSLRR